MRSLLAGHAKAGREVGRHAVIRTGTPWLAVFAWGNSASPETAEYLSRAIHSLILIPGGAVNIDAPDGPEDYARTFLLPVLRSMRPELVDARAEQNP